jgi:hypothetical protein
LDNRRRGFLGLSPALPIAPVLSRLSRRRSQAPAYHVEDDTDHERPHDDGTHDRRLESGRCAVRADLGESRSDHQRCEGHDTAEQRDLARPVAEEA